MDRAAQSQSILLVMQVYRRIALVLERWGFAERRISSSRDCTRKLYWDYAGHWFCCTIFPLQKAMETHFQVAQSAKNFFLYFSFRASECLGRRKIRHLIRVAFSFRCRQSCEGAFQGYECCIFPSTFLRLKILVGSKRKVVGSGSTNDDALYPRVHWTINCSSFTGFEPVGIPSCWIPLN